MKAISCDRCQLECNTQYVGLEIHVPEQVGVEDQTVLQVPEQPDLCRACLQRLIDFFRNVD